MIIYERLPKRRVGKTTLAVTTLGFGGAPIGNLYRSLSEQNALKTLSTAIKSGVSFFDTAPRYGAGLSERRIGDVLRSIAADQYVLSTKVGRLFRAKRDAKTDELRYGFLSPMPFEPEYNYTYDGIMRSWEDSLQRLGIAHIDILLVHDLGKFNHGKLDTLYFQQFESSGYRALEELRGSGDVTAVGLGVNETEVCERAMEVGRFDCFLLAGRYTLLEQRALSTFFPKCESHGASIILGGPYNSGILASGVRSGNTPYYDYEPAKEDIIRRVASIEDVCSEFEVPLPAAALQFPLANPLVSSIIPGLDSDRQVQQAVAYLNLKIPLKFWETLKSKGLIEGNAPVPTGSG